MTGKELTVFSLGIMLIGFIYFMKHPSPDDSAAFRIKVEKTVGIDTFDKEPESKFDPTTKLPIYEKIMDIPAWQFDLAALTSDELAKSAQKAIIDRHFFQPEKQSALYYLANLKLIDDTNPHISELNQALINELKSRAQLAIEENQEKELVASISRLKSLHFNQKSINAYEQKLATIKTINLLFKKGSEQLLNNNIIAENSEDAWHTAKQIIEIDVSNPKSQQMVLKVTTTLVDSALRSAEESDFQLAQIQIDQAKLLAPDSFEIIESQDEIDRLKQQRYQWLEQQLSDAINRTNIQRANRMIRQLNDLGIQKSQLSEYQAEIDRMTIFGKFKPFEIFTETDTNNQKLPHMVVMPIGEFTMGSNTGVKHEKPAHKVFFNYGFAISQNEISVSDFELFITDQDYKTDAETNKSSKIYDIRSGRLKNKNRIDWKKDYMGKKSETNNPVIHVSWNDALAYTQWLSQQTGENYRLVTEAEFEYALRAGTKTNYPWGNDTPIQITENLTGKLDRSKKNSRIRWKKGFDKYNDKYWGPAPVGSFITNQFKLNDTAGNVMEWVMDCWHDSYTRAPIDGSTWINQGCENHVIRGGSWSSSVDEFTSSHRLTAKANFTDARLGFRIARDL